MRSAAAGSERARVGAGLFTCCRVPTRDSRPEQHVDSSSYRGLKPLFNWDKCRHRSPLTSHRSPLTSHRSPLTFHPHLHPNPQP
eukprot:scaffold130575_cov45-Phaeocystis_antarctica.AAC.2